MDQSSYTAINIVADVKIPAIKVSEPYCGEIYACYRAGILNSADASGAFRPQSGIKRSEVAAILSRMYTPLGAPERSTCHKPNASELQAQRRIRHPALA